MQLALILLASSITTSIGLNLDFLTRNSNTQSSTYRNCILPKNACFETPNIINYQFVRGNFLVKFIATFCSISIVSLLSTTSPTLAIDLREEVISYEESTIQGEKEPDVIMQKVNRKLQPNKPFRRIIPDNDLTNSRERILTLKAYLDEIERDVFSMKWDKLQSYLYTFSEQENAFASLIDGLFPSDNDLDKVARIALSFEAKGIFVALEDLREAARNEQIKPAQNAYAQLLLSYDRFLKAGDLYPTYDPITSTEIFFTNFPKESLRYDRKNKPDVLDTVLLISGPDMGKTGKIININGNYAIVKFDNNGQSYQEVKIVKLDMLGKTLIEYSILYVVVSVLGWNFFVIMACYPYRYC